MLILVTLYARVRALMARPWSARCYGVARQRERSRQNRMGGPHVNSCYPLRAREGADGQAVVCPLLRGSSPTRAVAPKQHGEARACFLSGISGWLYPLARGAWVPKKIWRGEASMVSAAAMLLDRLGPPGRRRRRVTRVNLSCYP